MHQYLVFYKPYFTLCQFSPEGDKQTLADYLPGIAKNIYPVGRLDYDSEGLLLLTDDKALTNQLLNPKFAHPRTYYAEVEGAITVEALQQLCTGVSIQVDGKQYVTKPAKASLLLAIPDLPPRNPPVRFRKHIPTSWISLTLIEGKNRQVRKMTAATGYPTLRLVRFAIGDVNIDGLEPGTYRLFNSDIKGQLGL